jgi:hypothetical protein
MCRFVKRPSVWLNVYLVLMIHVCGDLWQDKFEKFSHPPPDDYESGLCQLMKEARTSRDVSKLVDLILSRVEHVDGCCQASDSWGYSVLVKLTKLKFPGFGSIKKMQNAAGELVAQCKDVEAESHDLVESLAVACKAHRDMHATLVLYEGKISTCASEVAGKLLLVGASFLLDDIKTWHCRFKCEQCKKECESKEPSPTPIAEDTPAYR